MKSGYYYGSAYSVKRSLYIEDVLYTPREVLAEIPELEEQEIDRIIALAQEYESQFEAE